MRFLIRSLIALFFFISSAAAYAQPSVRIDISVTGLAEDLQQNVLAHLSIARQKDSPRMTDYLVKRLAGKAKNEVRKALEPFGYYRPEVDLDLLQEEKVWRVEIDVNPGNPVVVDDVRVEISGPGSRDELLARAVRDFPLQKGEILNHQLYEQGKRNLIARANASGFLDADFSEYTILVNRETDTAEIILVLNSGQQYLFGSTTFEADFLSHGLLGRMRPYREGEPFSSRALVRFRQSLYNTGYFSSVEVAAADLHPENLSIPVRVALTPKNPNTFGLGLGYGTDTGLRGTVEWNNRLLNRFGHQFKLTLQPSERKSSYGGVYTIPIKDPLRDRLSLLAKWEKENFENTESEQRSASLSYDHIRDAGEFSIYFKFLDEDFDSGVETGHATLFIPGLKTTFRIADDRLVTGRGIRATLNLSGADENLLSDTRFLQASVAAKGIYSLGESWRVIGRFQLGGTVVDDINELPPSLRFYAGGDQSIRGYAYKSIGPRDPRGNILGGQYLLTCSAELEKQFTDSWSAAIFFDSGDAPDNLTDLAMKNGAGVGVRWNAPFGQIRLDLAKALSDWDDSWRIHFNMGADL